jgi:hypothetical protein
MVLDHGSRGTVELPASAEAALGNFGMRVSPESILGVYAVVMDEVTKLERSLMNFQKPTDNGSQDHKQRRSTSGLSRGSGVNL